tara:strand:- start:94 stop:333 length:240 start_codon:yes stop_codon:yes gene_type:complete
MHVEENKRNYIQVVTLILGVTLSITFTLLVRITGDSHFDHRRKIASEFDITWTLLKSTSKFFSLLPLEIIFKSIRNPIG